MPLTLKDVLDGLQVADGVIGAAAVQFIYEDDDFRAGTREGAGHLLFELFQRVFSLVEEGDEIGHCRVPLLFFLFCKFPRLDRIEICRRGCDSVGEPDCKPRNVLG
jgi:hypothetical protein